MYTVYSRAGLFANVVGLSRVTRGRGVSRVTRGRGVSRVTRGRGVPVSTIISKKFLSKTRRK